MYRHSEDVHLLRTPCSFFLSICRLPNRLLELNINRQRSNFVFHSLQPVYRLHTSRILGLFSVSGRDWYENDNFRKNNNGSAAIIRDYIVAFINRKASKMVINDHCASTYHVSVLEQSASIACFRWV